MFFLITAVAVVVENSKNSNWRCHSFLRGTSRLEKQESTSRMTSSSSSSNVAATVANSIAINFDQFESERFNVDTFVKRVTAESIYASSLVEVKDKLNRNSQQTAEEIKQSVYKNYTNFMETAKEVDNLEGKMSQLRLSLDEQKKLLLLIKNLNVASIADVSGGGGGAGNKQASQASKSSASNSSTQSAAAAAAAAAATKSSLSILLEQVEGCGLIAQKPGRTLIYHSDLEALHVDDYSVSHKLHAYLLSDALLLTLPQRKRNKSMHVVVASVNHHLPTDRVLLGSYSSSSSSSSSSYQYKFQAFYELQDIKVMSIDDSKEVRNAFQVLKFPESLAFRCSKAQIKKEWLEQIDSVKKQLESELLMDEDDMMMNGGGDDMPLNRSGARGSVSTEATIHEEDEDDQSADSASLADVRALQRQKRSVISLGMSLSDPEQGKMLRDLFADFDILLAQRDFEKSVDVLLRLKTATLSSSSTSVQQLIYKQKERELIGILRKDLAASKERGNNSKGVVKTGKRVVASLIRLKIYDEAIDMFIDYHKHLNAETLRKIKLEESNNIYMSNVLHAFFENMRLSYSAFREAFADLLNFCYSSYHSWCDTEIELLIKKLQSQHYLGRHFDLTMENCELIFAKARDFSARSFDVRFLFETKLAPIIEATVRQELAILVEATHQRAKLELDESAASIEPNRQMHAHKLIGELHEHVDACSAHFALDEATQQLVRACSSATIQFSRGLVNFLVECLRVYYQEVGFCIVEAVTVLFKTELKIYHGHLSELRKLANAAAASEEANATDAASIAPPLVNGQNVNIFIYTIILN